MLSREVALADSLTKRDPTNTVHAQYLCVTYSRLGDTQMILGASDAALVCYQKYIAVAHQLVAMGDTDNIQFNRELYLAYYKIGEAQSALGAHDAAMEAYQSSTTIIEELVALHPQRHEFALARDATYSKQAQLSKTDVDKTLSSFWAEQILRQAE